MNISENFDRWMFDYKEGNLSAAEAEEFENFLLNHPEFEVDADAWDMAFVQQAPVEYPFQHKLEKKRRVAAWYYWGAAATLMLLISSSAIYLFSTNDDLQTAVNKGQNSLELASANHSMNSNSVVSNSSNQQILLTGLTASSPNSTTNRSSAVFGNTSSNGSSLQSGSAHQNGSGHVVNTIGQHDLSKGDGQTQSDLILLESQKIQGDNDAARYLDNPQSKELGFDVSKKGSMGSGGSYSALRKVYNRIERMLGYPVGLTNLRDQELLLPQSTVLAFNPAFTGGMLSSRFEINYRNQWLGSEQNSSELNISYDNYSYNMRGGVGFLINAQDYGYGQFGDYNFSLLYSPKLVVGKNVVIEPAVKLTLGSMVANGDVLAPESAFEMDRGRILNTISDNQMNGITQQWYKDYGLGLMVNTKWFYAGFSSDNLGRHYENVYGNELSSPSQSPIKLSGIIGTDYVSNIKAMTFSPFVAYQQYGDKPEFWAGMNYRVGFMTLGGAISSNQEFTASAGLKFDRFKLVYHYDHTESAITQTRMGSHNIGIRFNAQRKNQRLTH